MQIRLAVVDPTHPSRSCDITLNAGAGASAHDVRRALVRLMDLPTALDTALFVDGTRLDERVVPGRPPLVDGAVITIGRPGSASGRRPAQAGGFLELHVVGGPDAGQVLLLTPGAHRIGRAGSAEVSLDDPDLSRWHAQVELGAAGVLVRDLGSTNGTRVDGARDDGCGLPLREGARLVVGGSTLALRRPDLHVADTRPSGAGTIAVNTSPRIPGTADEVVLHVPALPEAPTSAGLPFLAMLLPLVVAVPLAVLWSPYALLFAVMAPVMTVGTVLGDRRAGRRTHRRAVQAWQVASARTADAVAEALRAELAARRHDHPDPAELGRCAAGPGRRLWERRVDDPDALHLLVGTATLPAWVRLVDAGAGAIRRPALDDAPVVVPLAEVGVLGVAGGRGRTVGLVTSLLGQLVTLHSPRDLAVVVLSGPRDDPSWDWVARLPHARPGAAGGVADPRACEALVGATAEQVRRRVAELVALLEARSPPGASRAGPTPPRVWAGTRVVVLVDQTAAKRGVPGLARLLHEGPAAGIYFLCVDDDAAALPAECGGTVLLRGEVGTGARVALSGRDPLDDVVPALCGSRWAQRLATALAPLRDATPDAGGRGLPDAVRLVDVLPAGVDDPVAVARVWVSQVRTTKAVIGIDTTGPYVVDLRLDGPHVLVAGTTGAGKSELLRTLITSLALGNRPTS